MAELLDGDVSPEVADLVTLGLHHEQQHQELLLMDIKHVLGSNPLRPAYAAGHARTAPAGRAAALGRRHRRRARRSATRATGFAFDNESPRHEVLLRPLRLADRPVTNGEWLEFIDDGGYQRRELWLSDGWASGPERAVGAPRSTGSRSTASGTSSPWAGATRSTPDARWST